MMSEEKKQEIEKIITKEESFCEKLQDLYFKRINKNFEIIERIIRENKDIKLTKNLELLKIYIEIECEPVLTFIFNEIEINDFVPEWENSYQKISLQGLTKDCFVYQYNTYWDTELKYIDLRDLEKIYHALEKEKLLFFELNNIR